MFHVKHTCLPAGRVAHSYFWLNRTKNSGFAMELGQNHQKTTDYTELGVLTPKIRHKTGHAAQLPRLRSENRSDKTGMETGVPVIFGINATKT